MYGVCDPATLEAIACREAISLAEDIQLQSFIISSDCKQVVEDIMNGSNGLHRAIINEIKSRSVPFSCNFIFESRAVNFEAHRLAKFARNLAPGLHVWPGQRHDPVCIPPSVEFDQ